MAMVGHRAEAISRRYAIVDEVMLREGAVNLAGRSSRQAGVSNRIKRLPEGSVTKARF
jgi:hypothetical protein